MSESTMASYYKRKNGTYCVRVSNGIKDGKQHLISATYKPPVGATPAAAERGAREFAALFEAAVHNGIYIPGTKPTADELCPLGMTVEFFIRNHYYARIERKLSPNTVRFNRSICEQFIIPSFGAIRLTDITPRHMQAFIDYLAGSGSRADTDDPTPLSGATVKRYATVLNSVMTEACRAGFVEINRLRASSPEYPKIVKKALEVYDDREAERFYRALADETAQTQGILLAALLLGLRRGEIVALRWSDIDLDNRCLHVTHSAYKFKDEKQALKSPKSISSLRTIHFPPVYVTILRAIKEEQSEQKQRAAGRWIEQDFVFTTATGDMISVYTPTRLCSRFEQKCGLRHLKLHGLRHTCVSLLVGHGMDPETAKTMLGHESLRTTDLYLHPYEKNLRKAAALLERVIVGEGQEVDD